MECLTFLEVGLEVGGLHHMECLTFLEVGLEVGRATPHGVFDFLGGTFWR